MSLKAFHLFFIAVSILLTLFFGAWSIVEFQDGRDGATLVWGITSLVISIGLVAYGAYAIRKLKGVSLI
jgi:hypothetical protein